MVSRMINRRVFTAAAVGFAALGISIGTAWAGGPPGVTDDTPGPPGSYGGMFAAVGSGTFEDFSDGVGTRMVEVGYDAFGNTAEEATSSLVGQCQAEGGVNCSADMVTNDNLCIVSVADGRTNVNAGGAGPTIEAARLDAIARAAASNMPMSPESVVLISNCP